MANRINNLTCALNDRFPTLMAHQADVLMEDSIVTIIIRVAVGQLISSELKSSVNEFLLNYYEVLNSYRYTITFDAG